MFKYAKDFTGIEAYAFCQAHFNKATNRCENCPAKIAYTRDVSLCYFHAKRAVQKADVNLILNDGSISDEDLPYWQK